MLHISQKIDLFFDFLKLGAKVKSTAKYIACQHLILVAAINFKTHGKCENSIDVYVF